MRKLFFILILYPTLGLGQTFSLTDTVFEEGAILARMVAYDFTGTQDYVLEESYPFMDSLVAFMNANPTIKIEVGNYIDQRGSEYYNQKITEDRAESAVYYLVSKGIAKDRLTAVGYGETKFIYTEKDYANEPDMAKREEMYVANRRTEFKIVGL